MTNIESVNKVAFALMEVMVSQNDYHVPPHHVRMNDEHGLYFDMTAAAETAIKTIESDLLEALKQIAYISDKVGNSEKEANEMGDIARAALVKLKLND